MTKKCDCSYENDKKLVKLILTGLIWLVIGWFASEEASFMANPVVLCGLLWVFSPMLIAVLILVWWI